MIVKYKYSPNNEAQLGVVLKIKAMSFVQNLTNAFISPAKQDLGFVFICGCGHSGTTLLASRLGNHPDAMLIGRESQIFLPPNGLYAAREMIAEWSRYAVSSHKSFIIEKTPKHVLTMNKIFKLVPNAKLVLLTRNPIDTIASLHKRLGCLERCIERWLLDSAAAAKMLEHPQVKIVKYEQLVQEPHYVLQDIATFVGLGWRTELEIPMASAYAANVRQGGNMALRVSQISKPIQPNIGGWAKILDVDAAEEILTRTKMLAGKLGYREEELRKIIKDSLS